MQHWLRERHEAVPHGDPSHEMMAGMDHARLMPGMLTAEQLAQLDGAKGSEFDRLFLTFMIQHPREIAYFDRGPMDSTKLVSAGSWSVYWYNGYLVSSEISRGLDILELTPSGFISQNEIDAARIVRFEYLNAQEQPKLVWPASFALARAYLDQLARSNGLGSDRLSAVRNELSRSEQLSGQPKRDALTRLANQLHQDATGAGDQAKVHILAAAVGELANAGR
ncbi:MAG TPA: DUF305 domain-containing protein [Gemmatimonadales bacterium]